MSDSKKSALDLVPIDTVAYIRAGRGQIREDLRVIEEAEAAGWKVTFLNNDWQFAARFERAKIVVWSTGRDWRRVNDARGQSRTPAVFPYVGGLRKALQLDSE